MNRFLSFGLAAGCAMLVQAGAGRADDVIRLGGGNVEATTQTLGFDGDVNTELMRGYHGGHHGGYHHGGYHAGYHHGGYHHGYHYGGYRFGGYRGYYSPFYASFYFGRPYYSSYYYRPYYYGASYYQPYYYPSYYSYPAYYYGCADDVGSSQTAVLGTAPSYRAESLPPPQQVMPPPDASNGTYRYDGDPQIPLPMPGAEPGPGPTKAIPRPTLPRDGRLVSLPASNPYTFQAYGEQPAAKERPAESRVVNTTPSGARYAFPAYGEQPTKTNR